MRISRNGILYDSKNGSERKLPVHGYFKYTDRMIKLNFYDSLWQGQMCKVEEKLKLWTRYCEEAIYASSIVRMNMLEDPDYRPYCGGAFPCIWPRTDRTSTGFRCPYCGWHSEIDQGFWQFYKQKHNIKNTGERLS